MNETIRAELARHYQNASTMAYKAIEFSVTQTSLALSRIALCVHHRTDIFGTDVGASGNYITATIQAAQSWCDQAVDTLTYAHFFDTTNDKDSVYEDTVERILEVHTRLSATNHGLLVIAQTDRIDETFPAAPESENPRAHFLQMHHESLAAFEMARIMIVTRRDSLPALVSVMDQCEAIDLTQDRAVVGAYHDLCERHGKELYAYENTLKAMKFTP